MTKIEIDMTPIRGGLTDSHARLRPDPTLIHRIGGPQMVRAVIDGMYDRIQQDPGLNFIFPSFQGRGTLADFFIEWMGGERLYSASAWATEGGLARAHDRFFINRQIAGKWLGHFKASLIEQGVSPDLREEVLDVLAPLAMGLAKAGDEPAEKLVKASCHIKQNQAWHDFEKLLRNCRLDDVVAAVEADASLLNRRGNQGRTLLWEAAGKGRTKLVQWLLDHDADATLPGCSPLEVTLGCPPPKGTFVLVTPYAHARFRGRKAAAKILAGDIDLFTAAFTGDIRSIEQLLDANPDTVSEEDLADDTYRITSLHHAVAGGQLEAAELLIQRGAAVPEYSQWLLTYAAARNRPDLVKLLLEAGADARCSLVVGPLDAEDLAVAKLLVGHGFDVNHSLRYGPMIVRCCRPDVSSNEVHRVEALLRLGADPNAGRGHTLKALHYAARSGKIPLIKLLISQGADPNAQDGEGLTPLFHLPKSRAKLDPVEVLKALNGADLNARTETGESILFHYTRRGDANTVEWLLAHGADPQLKDAQGRTAVSVAGRRADSRLHALLDGS